MKAVLLVLSPESLPNRALQRACALAKQLQATLFAVVVLPARHLEALAGQLIDSGFVGEKLSEDVLEHVRREQFAMAEELLHDVREAAAGQGIEVVTEVVEGDPRDACEWGLTRASIVRAVVPVRARAWLERFWRRRESLDWAQDLECEIEQVEES